MKQKRTFLIIFAFLALLLIVTPFLVSFNEALTKLVEKFTLYTWVQDKIVPVEVSMVRILISPLGISFTPFRNGMLVKGTFLEITWNCLGWQSLLLLLITFYVGLGGKNYTFWSKTETILIGFLGTFLVNLFRLTFIVLLYNYATPIYFYIYHDYLAAIVTVIWLVFFWWFSYKFVLEEK